MDIEPSRSKLGLDDVTDMDAIESLAVSIFDRATKATLAGGEVMPRGGLIFTTNKLRQSERSRMIHFTFRTKLFQSQTHINGDLDKQFQLNLYSVVIPAIPDVILKISPD